jgi:hypothetical protein
MCELFHQLPRGGGLLDQDCYLAVLMDIVVTEKKDKEAEDHHRDEVRARNQRGRR